MLPDGSNPNFSAVTNDDTLTITAVSMRRKTIHSVRTYPDLLLHLEEFHETSAVWVKERGHYEGATQAPDKKTTTEQWWQVSITSFSAVTTLKENEMLELGDIAQWNPEDLIRKGIIKDMYNLAEDIVTRIDGVGLGNRGLRSKSGSKSNTRTKTSTQMSTNRPPPGLGAFW